MDDIRAPQKWSQSILINFWWWVQWRNKPIPSLCYLPLNIDSVNLGSYHAVKVFCFFFCFYFFIIFTWGQQNQNVSTRNCGSSWMLLCRPWLHITSPMLGYKICILCSSKLHLGGLRFKWIQSINPSKRSMQGVVVVTHTRSIIFVIFVTFTNRFHYQLGGNNCFFLFCVNINDWINSANAKNPRCVRALNIFDVSVE